MSDNGLTGIKKRWVGGDEVIIPRAQYDALMAAAKAFMKRFPRLEKSNEVMEALAAPRAAGIQTEET